MKGHVKGHGARKANAYRKFTVILATSVVLIGVLLGFVINRMVHQFVVGDTVNVTREAVEKHFGGLPPLARILERSGKAQDGPGAYGGSHNGHDAAGAQGGLDDYEGLKQMVQMHFNLYSVEKADIIFPDGQIAFSYDPSKIGTKVSDDKMYKLHQALGGQVVTEREKPSQLYVWVPIRDGKSGNVVGVVKIMRDISPQLNAIRSMTLKLLVVIVLGMLLLFLALRHLFIRSSRTIDTQNSELLRLVRQIERTYDESLQALSSALDSRDNETQGHSFRVTSYAIRLGRQMKLSDQELGFLARGALLHDVGKIGVPDSILMKPGKLTEHEWETMKRHVDIGYQMLKHIEFLSDSLDVVKYHHERWDGRGYPNGLKGEQIPVFARIFSLCDTYDAITSDRPYRKGKGYAEAREEIVAHRGTQFCPEVVDAFLQIPEEEWVQIQKMSETGEEHALLNRMLAQVSLKQRVG